jgi:hypothetical protein
MTTETNGLFDNDPALDDNYEPLAPSGSEDLLNTLVGEDKKYKSPADLAYAKLAADAHIKKIQEENKVLRDSLARQKALEDLLAQVNRKDDAPSNAINPGNPSGESGAPSPDDLVAKVLSSLEERNREAQRQANMKQVQEALPAALGPNWKAELRSRLADAGVDETLADQLAKDNPKAFFRLIGADAAKPATPPAGNSLLGPAPTQRVNSTAAPVVSGEKTQSYYDRVKKEMGVRKFYEDRKLQAEIHSQALKLGDRFFDK